MASKRQAKRRLAVLGVLGAAALSSHMPGRDFVMGLAPLPSFHQGLAPRRILFLRSSGETVTEAAAPESTSPEQESTDEPAKAVSGVSSSLRDRLAARIAAQEATVAPVPTEAQKTIKQQKVDLNGVDPITCVAGAIPVAALSYGFWTFTGRAAEYFVTHPIDSDFYPVQRLGVVFQTAMVGLGSLAAGIFGFTALGLLLLGIQVAYGVATGELDPNKKSIQPERQSTAEKVRDLFTQDPVKVAMASRKRKSELAGNSRPKNASVL